MIDIKIQRDYKKKFIDFLQSQIQIHLTNVYEQNSRNSIATKEKERKQTSLLMRKYIMFEMMILHRKETNLYAMFTNVNHL